MFRLLCLPMLFMALLLVAAPALAQEPAGGGSASQLTAEEARALSLLLQEESRRQALVDKLNALAEAEEAQAQEPAAPQDESLPRQIAEFTQQSAESVATLLSRVLNDLQGLAQIGEGRGADYARSEEHTSELQSLMRTSYAGFSFKKKKNTH